VSDASGKGVVKAEVPPELLSGVPYAPQGGVEITTPNPTKLSQRELARLKKQAGMPVKKNRRKSKSRR
jgi:hypothetical protein